MEWVAVERLICSSGVHEVWAKRSAVNTLSCSLLFTRDLISTCTLLQIYSGVYSEEKVFINFFDHLSSTKWRCLAFQSKSPCSVCGLPGDWLKQTAFIVPTTFGPALYRSGLWSGWRLFRLGYGKEEISKCWFYLRHPQGILCSRF